MCLLKDAYVIVPAVKILSLQKSICPWRDACHSVHGEQGSQVLVLTCFNWKGIQLVVSLHINPGQN